MIARHPLAIAIGAAAGIGLWVAFAAVRDALPIWVRLVIAGGLLAFGPGAAAVAPLVAALTPLARIVLSFCFGLAFAPMLAHALSTAGGMETYPYLCAGLSGGAVTYWRGVRTDTRPGLGLAPVVLAIVMVGAGAAAFAHRLDTTGSTVAVHGDYDSYDLTYYAAIAAELSHTNPPASPFYTGRMLNHAYYPHVVLATIHRFGGVPLLDLYFRYAWPAFLVLVVLACFVFVEAIADRQTAFLAALLFGVGSNLAYLVGWFAPQPIWDNVIWSHNFQGAGAEVLFYGNWTPAFAVMFGGLYALNRSCRPGTQPAWAMIAGAALASTVLAKPWIFAIVMAAIAATLATSWRDTRVFRRLLLVIASGLLVAAPLLYRTVTLYDDAQVRFVPAFLPIPLVMAGRIGLREWFLARASGFGLTGLSQEHLAAALALPVFLAGSLGFRLAGIGALWRSLRYPAAHDPIWRVLGWSVVASLAASSFIMSVPYHETTQIHQCALFLMVLFTARALMTIAVPKARLLAAAATVAIAIPCTVQYLHGKWTDRGQPLVETARGETTLASILQSTDAEHTAILHDRPNEPSLLGILAERRSILSWAGYTPAGSEARRADVEAFFASPDEARALAVLRATGATHVVEREGRDRLNAAVRDRLELVSRAGEVALYRVREGLAAR